MVWNLPQTDSQTGKITWNHPADSLFQNRFIERFNCTYRTEVLDLYLFKNVKQVRKITEKWLVLYNKEKPHEAY